MQNCYCWSTAEGSRNLVFTGCCRGVFIADRRLNCRAGFLLFEWRRSSWTVGDFFSNPCHHVVGIFCTTVSSSLTLREACFRARITLGFVSVCSLVCAKCVPGRLWSESGVNLNWRVQRNLLVWERSLKILLLVLLNSLNSFFVILPSLSSKTWMIKSSYDLGTFVFCAILLLGCSSQFSLFRAASFHLFLRVAIFYKEYWTTIRTEFLFYEKTN